MRWQRDSGASESSHSGYAAGEAVEEKCGAADEEKFGDGDRGGWVEAIGGGNRDDVGGDFSAGGEMDNGVAGEEAASVVVAAGSGRRKALTAGSGLGSEGALGGAATSGLISGRDIGAVTVDPHELTTQVHRQLHRNQRGSLPELDDVLERWVFCDGEEESLGAEGGGGNGGGEEEEENRGEEGEGSGGRH